jgi:hypothetical protein
VSSSSIPLNAVTASDPRGTTTWNAGSSNSVPKRYGIPSRVFVKHLTA